MALRRQSSRTVRAGGRSIPLTNADKVLFPREGVTKGELVEYYRRVAGRMVPYLRGRPVMMQRLPDGMGGEEFLQKEAPAYFPKWIPRVRVPKEGGALYQIVCDDAATLVYLAAQACITPHVWLSRSDRLDVPDRLIIDIDPSDGHFADARSAAEAARVALSEAGLVPFLMATGSRGFHVVAPLRRGEGFDEVRRVARGLAAAVAALDPDLFTTEPRKAARRGRVYLDHLRNAYAQTAVPPYAVRARPGATIAVPLDWSELPDADPAGWSIRAIDERLQRADPWRGMARRARSLAAAKRWLQRR